MAQLSFGKAPVLRPRTQRVAAADRLGFGVLPNARCPPPRLFATPPAAAAEREPKALARKELQAAVASALPAVESEAAARTGGHGWWMQLLSQSARVMALGVIALTLVLGAPGDALAKGSGGRMGGMSGFRSGGGSSYSSGSSRSGGYGGGGGYSSGGGFSRGGSTYSGGGGMAFGGGSSVRAYSFYGGGAYVAPPIYSPGPSVMFGGPSVVVSPPAYRTGAAYDSSGYLVLAMLMTVFVLGAVMTTARGLQSHTERSAVHREFEAAAAATSSSAAAAGDVSVWRVQVALLSTARKSLQRDLIQLANNAQTETPAGLRDLMQEVVVLLQRRSEAWAYGAVDRADTNDMRQAERWVQELSVGERSRYQSETRSNYSGRRSAGGWQATSRQEQWTQQGVDELVVVTLVVAARPHRRRDGGGSSVRLGAGGSKGRKELQSALRTVQSVRSDELLSVEVLWTPEAPDDTFSREDLVEDYPHMQLL